MGAGVTSPLIGLQSCKVHWFKHHPSSKAEPATQVLLSCTRLVSSCDNFCQGNHIIDSVILINITIIIIISNIVNVIRIVNIVSFTIVTIGIIINSIVNIDSSTINIICIISNDFINIDSDTTRIIYINYYATINTSSAVSTSKYIKVLVRFDALMFVIPSVSTRNFSSADLGKMEQFVRSIEKDGLLWGSGK